MAESQPATEDRQVEEPEADRTAVRMKLWQSGSAALGALVFWVAVLLLPDTIQPWSHTAVTWCHWIAAILCVVGVAIFGVGLAIGAMRRWGEHRGEVIFTGVFLALTGVALLVVTAACRDGLDLASGRGLALGVGGVALAGFVFAATQFDTIRASASVAVVLLLIGVTTWPNASELISSDVRTALIQWMGVLLGINGAAEAAKQVGESFARAGSGPGFRASRGDLATRVEHHG
jgi:hypothetical protein